MYFLDSSIIIEALKGNENAVLLWEKILKKGKLILFINEVVYSETFYQLSIKKNFPVSEIYKLLRKSTYFLPINELIIDLSVEAMNNYKLLPNDSFILGTCKFYQIPNLISLDTDFIEPCIHEKINLINSTENFIRR